jgi:TRAP-type C4-dicarboxylate transport system permease small subunit
MWALLGKLLAFLNLIAALLIVAIMFLITTDVIGRAFFAYPLYGVPEITKLSIICMVWLQMAYTLRVRQHLRSTLIVGALPIIPRRAVLLLNCVAGSILMAIIAYYAYPELVRSYRLGYFEGEHPVRVPTWPIWAIVVLGSALTAIEYVIQGYQAIRGDDDNIAIEPLPAVE